MCYICRTNFVKPVVIKQRDSLTLTAKLEKFVVQQNEGKQTEIRYLKFRFQFKSNFLLKNRAQAYVSRKPRSHNFTKLKVVQDFRFLRLVRQPSFFLSITLVN